MKKFIIALLLLNSSAFADSINLGGTFVLQNTTNDTLKINYQTCSKFAGGGNSQSLCSAQNYILLTSQTSNFKNPIRIVAGAYQNLQVTSVVNMTKGGIQAFGSNCAAQGSSGVNKIISFAPILGETVVQCVVGNF